MNLNSRGFCVNKQGVKIQSRFKIFQKQSNENVY